MIDQRYRHEILKASIEARVREITEYQVNIDNFRLALEACQDEADMSEFREQLQELLASSIREQRKAQIMLSVIKKQLSGEAQHVG